VANDCASNRLPFGINRKEMTDRTRLNYQNLNTKNGAKDKINFVPAPFF